MALNNVPEEAEADPQTGTETDAETGTQADPPDHEIVVIGAGLSGVGMGVKLLEHGFRDFVILERADALGGVWRDNTYPGISVDIPSQAYQFDYFPKPDWSRAYADGAEVKQYVEEMADHFGLRPYIKLNRHVTERRWNEDHEWWELDVSGRCITTRWVISAIGSFGMPKQPEIPGLEDFAGKLLRSAAWDHDYDTAGKRLAVIGTGASAVQIIPTLAPSVAQMDVYQRTPIWVLPKPNPSIGPRVQRLFRRRPAVQRAVQRGLTAYMEWFLIKGVLGYDQPSHRRVVRALTWLLSEVSYRRQVPDAGLRQKLLPGYGLGCKRPGFTNTYLRALGRPNVELVTDPIEHVTKTGIRTRNGRERDVDAIVLATGFHMAYEPELYRREPVRGRGGFDLATFYAENRAQSYEGVSITGLPNHVFMYGPYGGSGGTWHEVIRASSAHAIRLISEAKRRGATTVEVRRSAMERWTDMAVELMGRSLFLNNNCGPSRSYFIDRNGHVPFLRPTSAADALEAQRTFPFADYRFTRGGATVGPGGCMHPPAGARMRAPGPGRMRPGLPDPDQIGARS